MSCFPKRLNSSSMFKIISKREFYKLIEEYKQIQLDFLREFNVNDIFSNSKIYEIIIANQLDHFLIPGHSGSKDAKDERGNIYEYKHYKESSKNHTWTFNDFSDKTIEDLKKTKSVIFAHIEDISQVMLFDWYYDVNGKEVSNYLANATKAIKNTRKMINISSRQIENNIKVEKKVVKKIVSGKYDKWINKILQICNKIESLTDTKGILTSNKFWEVLTAVELGHNVNSEQGGRDGAHDAYDKFNNLYEYKISKNYSWQFQDISENVLNKYLSDSKIILAVVDKTNVVVKDIYSANPKNVVSLLRQKLLEKENRFKLNNKEVRRLQISLTKGDLKIINAIKLI